jgi:phospholipid/cholesterol/gamma-HCH transport system permease protein
MAKPRQEKLRLFPFTRRAIQAMGKEWSVFLDTLGSAVYHTGAIIGFLLAGRFDFKQFIQQLAFVGVDTLGITLIMATFSGMVISLQIATEMVKQGAADFVGALVALAIVRELAPIMTAFSVIAMAGSAYAAELSTMQITNQVDALKVLHVNPVRYLMMPRILAGMTALPLMTIIAAITGILGGMLISGLVAELSYTKYLESVWHQVDLRDLFTMLLKSTLFGFIIFMMATTIGLNASGGSREVGVATTRAVVWSFVLMAIMDYLLTFLVYGTQ